MLIMMGPLLQGDLSSEYDSEVTVSDASNTGGAAAISTGPAWSGRSLVQSLGDPTSRAIDCPILLISCFNGIGGCFRIYDVLGLQVAGRISIEIDRCANRACRSA